MSIKAIFKRPSAVGIALGMVLMALSLTPSLIPRAWVEQAVIAALAFLCGYGIAVGLNALWRYLDLPRIPSHYQRTITGILLAVSGGMLAYFLYRSLEWQNNVRTTVGLDPIDSAAPLRVLLLTIVLVILLLIVLRLIWWAIQFIMRAVTKLIPRRIGQVLGAALAILFVVYLVNGVLIRTIFDFLNTTYSLQNNTSYDNIGPPTSPLRSGSPESLIAWNTLGREGQRFTATGPTAAEIAEFWGDSEAMEPIRVYVGAKSAPSFAEGADLALQELIRTGAFERDVLAVVTSTGNGWVDANSLNALEYMFKGDTALASFQYSYLPSVYSMLADKDAATAASMAYFNAIHQYWRQLDKDARPKLYLHGLSLGAYGSQAAVSHVSQFNDPVNGALWAGPPFVSEFWQQITRDREAGTPIWLPVYQDGTTIRFTNTGEGLQESEDAWLDNRFVYLQQAGDPIVFFPPDSLFRVPAWLQDGSRSPKAPSDMRWYPVVTFWQLIFDMVLATNDSLPDGNGHRYSSHAYIDSWVAITQPPDWSPERTQALKDLFGRLGNPNKP